MYYDSLSTYIIDESLGFVPRDLRGERLKLFRHVYENVNLRDINIAQLGPVHHSLDKVMCSQFLNDETVVAGCKSGHLLLFNDVTPLMLYDKFPESIYTLALGRDNILIPQTTSLYSFSLYDGSLNIVSSYHNHGPILSSLPFKGVESMCVLGTMNGNILAVKSQPIGSMSPTLSHLVSNSPTIKITNCTESNNSHTYESHASASLRLFPNIHFSSKVHRGRVRGLVGLDNRRLASLSPAPDGRIIITDLSRSLFGESFSVKYPDECIALTKFTDEVLITGSRGALEMIDLRIGKTISELASESVTRGWGFRQVKCLGNDIIAATANGKMVFADVRNMVLAYRGINESREDAQAIARAEVANIQSVSDRIGVVVTSVSSNQFSPYPNAIFSFCVSPSLHRVFLGGGPVLSSDSGIVARYL